MLSGSAEEIGQVFRMAGVPFATVSEVKPLPPLSAVVNQPVRAG